MVRDTFGAYGSIQQCKLMNYGTDCCVLLRMGSVEMASWMVENLNGNIPEGLETPVSVRYADSPTMKAKKIQQGLLPDPRLQGEDSGDFGKAKGGKGKGKGGPYGKDGKGKGKVQFGNLDPNLPPEVKAAV